MRRGPRSTSGAGHPAAHQPRRADHQPIPGRFTAIPRRAITLVPHFRPTVARSRPLIADVRRAAAVGTATRYGSRVTDNSPTLHWIRPSRCYANGECIELADTGDAIALRDSKSPELPHFLFSRAEVAAFIDAARRGEFDHLV